MKPFTMEEKKTINGCKALAKSVEADLKELYGIYFAKTCIVLNEFTKDSETEKLHGYAGFSIELPQDKRRDFAKALKSSIESVKPDIEKFKVYPFSKIIPQSDSVVAYFFGFQKNPTDFNNMNMLTEEEKMMLESKDPKILFEEEREQYKNRRHY